SGRPEVTEHQRGSSDDSYAFVLIAFRDLYQQPGCVDLVVYCGSEDLLHGRRLRTDNGVASVHRSDFDFEDYGAERYCRGVGMHEKRSCFGELYDFNHQGAADSFVRDSSAADRSAAELADQTRSCDAGHSDGIDDGSKRSNADGTIGQVLHGFHQRL